MTESSHYFNMTCAAWFHRPTCTDNTHDIAVGNDASVLDAEMGDATSNEAADTDDIAGISQSTV